MPRSKSSLRKPDPTAIGRQVQYSVQLDTDLALRLHPSDNFPVRILAAYLYTRDRLTWEVVEYPDG